MIESIYLTKAIFVYCLAFLFIMLSPKLAYPLVKYLFEKNKYMTVIECENLIRISLFIAWHFFCLLILYALAIFL